MTYTVEAWDQVDLNLQISPYGVPLDPLSVVLDFVEGSYAPLPLETPTLSIEYRAPLRTAGRSGAETALPLTPATIADSDTGLRWIRAALADHQARIRHQDAEFSDGRIAGAWGRAVPAHQDSGIAWGETVAVDGQAGLAWGRAQVRDRTGFVSSWIMKTPARDARPAMGWFTVNLTGTVYDDAAARRALLNTDMATSVILAGVGQPYTPPEWDAVALHFGYQPPKRPIVPHDKDVRITARQAAPRDRGHGLPWGAGQSVWQDYNLPYPVEENEPPPDPVDPPVRRVVYQIMNTLQITDVATSTPLDIQDVTLGLDIDSLSWKFSGTLYGQGSLALVQPDSQGMKDISVTINGHTWTFSIERYTSDERFPTSKFSISGVSRTQYMAAPFAPTRSYTNTEATTAAQAANAELLNTGFTLTWPTTGAGALPDWPIPAGALSYRDKSPAQVIGQIVKAAGGIMVPHRASDAWTIQSRYKADPWNWDSATPDAIVYIGMVRSRSAQYEPGPAFDACYVSGVNQGVAVDVQRQGSGGLNPMPDIYEDLITDSQPAINRGRVELSQSGNKVIETLSVLIPENAAAPKILTPGQLIKVTHDDDALDYFALVLSTSIRVQRAGGAEIYQSVTMERNA